jgi:very-short-patch-repair endonuclease
LRRRQTASELVLWQQLRGRRLAGWKFRRQHRIGPYFVDFVCLQARLVIELDGSQHAERAGYDLARTRFLEARGFRVLRYWNDAVFHRLDEMLDQIATALDAETCPSPACGTLSPHPRGEGNR